MSYISQLIVVSDVIVIFNRGGSNDTKMLTITYRCRYFQLMIFGVCDYIFIFFKFLLLFFFGGG